MKPINLGVLNLNPIWHWVRLKIKNNETEDVNTDFHKLQSDGAIKNL